MIGSRRTGGTLPVGPRRLPPPTQNFGPSRGGGGFQGNAFMPSRPPPGGQVPGHSFQPQPQPQPGPNFMPQVNPNDLMGGGDNGRNPLQHQDWWASHGWQYQPGQNRFTPIGQLQPLGRRTPNIAPGKNPAGHGPIGHDLFPHAPNPGGGHPGGGGGPGNGGNGGGGNGHGGGGNGGPGNGHHPGLPLDPYYEAQRRMLEDQLQASLSPLRSAHDQVLASNGLQQARMDTNQGVDTNQLLNEMAARGIFGSGIQNHDQGQLATDYLRQNQDLANATAGSLGDIASQRSAANLAYQQGLQEALLASAQRSNADKYAVASIGGKGHHGKRRTSKVRHETVNARRRRHG